MSGEVYFRDREHAGRLLAERLAHLAGEEPVVLGLVRGGVVVAAEVARKLQAPLDVIVARKLGAPFQPELAIGAVARDASFVDDDLVRALGISPHQVAEITAAAMREVERYEHKFRGGQPPVRIEGRTAIVVDDGLATGATAMAAVRSLRHQKPRRTVVGLPTCASDAARRLAVEVDEVVCLTEPIDFHAVGQWYENFTQVEDEEVEQLLEEAREREMSRSALQ